MAIHNDLGAKGEHIAQEYLISKGYEIRAVNYIHRKAEIDIIALHEDFLVVIEVKTRTAPAMVPLIQLVPPSKIHHLIRAANYYMQRYKVNNEARFDIVYITMDTHSYDLEHLKDAFYHF